MDKILSIITPVYKVEEWLSETIDSVNAQTFRDFEFLLIDDGSPDASSQICDENAWVDSRIISVHKVNGGVSSARNTGLDVAVGKYIGFVDSDDLIEPDMYEKMLGAAKETGAEVVQCRHDRGVDSPRPRGYYNSEKTIVTGEEFVDILFTQSGADYTNHVSLWAKVYLNTLWHKGCFPLGQVYEDEQETYKTCLKALKIKFIPDVLYHYIERENSIITGISARKIRDKQLAYKDRFYFIKNNIPNLTQKAAILFYDYSVAAMIELKESHQSDMLSMFAVLKSMQYDIFPYMKFCPKVYIRLMSFGIFRKWILQNNGTPMENYIYRVKRLFAGQ